MVAERLRTVTQSWVTSGRLDPGQATALVDDVMRALRGDNPELEKQAGRTVERNVESFLQDVGLARQKEVDELRGRIDRLEQALRARREAGDSSD
jgi:polyhydroxyalkanoate synthesis regulator phasin